MVTANNNSATQGGIVGVTGSIIDTVQVMMGGCVCALPNCMCLFAQHFMPLGG